MATLELEGITKEYAGQAALADVSLTVRDGELLVLLGPSGCGKSTLLRIVAGLCDATRGAVRVDGRDVTALGPAERDVALVFQNYALYPHMSVAKNLAFPLRMARVPKAEIDARVRATAETLGLAELLGRKPAQLSGGQMQRVALGRAIIRNPRLFLFDEPLSNLDAKLRDEMRAEIRALHERLGITTLYVTHDQAEAMTMGSRICVLRAGRIEQIGAPLEVFERPDTSFVAAFVGSPPMNLLRGVVAGGRFTCGGLSLEDAPLESGSCVLGIRPHEVREGGDVDLGVVSVEALGSRTLVACELGEEVLRVSFEGHREVRPGTRLTLAFPREHRRWFGDDGRRVSHAR